MYILSQVAVLILLALIVAVFAVMLRNSSTSRALSSEADESGSRFCKWSGHRSGAHTAGGWKPGKGTMLLPLLCVEQLNPQTMKPVKSFQVCRIPENGVTISRPDARTDGEECILLSDATREAYTVSANHARIGIDEAGMFLQDCGSHNRMYREGERRAIDETDITDGLVVFLGMQPLRFTIPGLCTEGGRENSGVFSGNPRSRAPLSFTERPVCRRKR